MSPDSEFSAALKTCLRADDSVWGHAALKRDPLYPRFAPDQREDIVSASLASGKAEAAALHARFGAEVRPSAIARQLGCDLTFFSDERALGSEPLYFAQFKKNTITLSGAMIEEIKSLQERFQLSPVLGYFDPAELLIAHELFHFLEEKNSSLETKSMRVKIRIGPFARRVCPAAAGEIGAFSFAKVLLKLRFYPQLVELIGLWRICPAAAEKLKNDLEILMEFEREDAVETAFSTLCDYQPLWSDKNESVKKTRP